MKRSLFLRCTGILVAAALAGWPAPGFAAEPERPELHPPDLTDGLAVSPAASAHLDTHLLTALGESIRKGELQKITSVLVMVDGKLKGISTAPSARRSTTSARRARR